MKKTEKAKSRRLATALNFSVPLLVLLTLLISQCKKDTFEGETTGICPIVLSTDPQDGEILVVTSKRLTVVFNESMDSTTLNSSTFILKNGGNQVSGTIMAHGNVATFEPSSYLEPNTLYSATITTGAKDPMGNALQDDYTWSFTTGLIADTLAPFIISTDPFAGETNVSLNKVITISFSESMDAASITANSIEFKQGSSIIPGTIRYRLQKYGTSATFTPTNNLPANSQINGTITTDVKDASGNSLQNPYYWSFTTGSALDNTAPTIISTDPINNATAVSLNKIISANFSEMMDPSSINATTFTLKQGATNVGGVVSYSGITALYIPNTKLSPSTIYTATITNLVRDASGNAMSSNYVWSFTTGTDLDVTTPTVISTDPANLAVNVPLGKTITATFSEPMNPLTLNSSTFIVKDGLSIVPGIYKYSGNTISFTPSSNLLFDRLYTAVITTGAKDIGGNGLASNYTWTFTTSKLTDIIKPTVVSTDPSNGAVGVALNKIIKATFSETMDPATINNTSFTLKEGVNSISGLVSYSRKTAAFAPTVALLPGTLYTATINTSVSDMAGNFIASTYTWSFTTGALADVVAPLVISTDPNNSDIDVPLNQIIKATFSEGMNPLSITSSSFYLKNGSTLISGVVGYSGSTAVFTPLSNLSSGTTYIATITTAAEDLAGNNLVTNYTWSFTTIKPAGPGGVNLRSAGAFAILAGAGVTNTGPTVINGDLGTSPTGTITGFPPGKVNGTIQAANPAASLAKTDLTTAFNDAMGRSTGAISLPGDLKGLTLAPGLYSNSSSVMISSGNVTLDAKGDANATFIFQMGSTLTTFTNTKVILAGGAQAKNIYWVVGTSATLGTYSIFYGNILADQAISFNTGAVLNGRALTRIAAVTLQSNKVNKP
jgi:hypothetical protein